MLKLLLYLLGLIFFVFINFRFFINDDYLFKFSKDEFVKFNFNYQLAEWEFIKTRDPLTNQLPPNIKAREQNFIQKIDNINLSKKSKLQSYLWESIGPFNIAGRIKEIEFDVSNENNILLASASGGIWYSSNTGQSWIKVFNANFEQSIYCLEQDKRAGKTHIWYCGTGELLSTTDRKFTNYARTIGLGNGIYKSTDNGLSWYKLTSTEVFNHSNISEPFQMIWDIKIDKFNYENDVIYAACFGSILRSTDGGKSWNIILGSEGNTSFSTDVEITETGVFYAALSSFSPMMTKPSITGLWRSEDGINWTNITPNNFPDDTRVIKIKSSLSNPNIIYVFTESPRKAKDPFFDFATSHHTLWKYTYNPSEKKGFWENRTNNLPIQDLDNINQTLVNGINSLGGYCFEIAVSPNDENLVYIAGTNLFYSNNGFATMSFQKLGGYQSRLHPDIHFVNFSPSDPNQIYVATDGGLYYTNNKFANPVGWMELNNNLITAQVYSVDIPKNIDRLAIVAGLQDQGSIITNENFTNYRQILGGDGLSCYFSRNGDFLLVSSYSSYIVGISLNNFDIISSRAIVPDDILSKTINFFTIFDVEPINENELYLALNNSIYRLDNLKEVIKNTKSSLNWTEIKIPDLNPDSKISFIKVVSEPNNRLYCGTSDGKLFIIDNAHSKPEIIDITSDKFPRNAYISCIAVDDKDSDNILITFSNYNVQSIFQSTDGGVTWLSQGGNLEENPDGTGAGPSIRWIEIANTDDETIYFAGTSSGLYYTKNLSGIHTVWIKVSPDFIGNIRIDQIKYRKKDATLIVATQGNGIFKSSLLTKIFEIKHNLNNHISVYPNPTNSQLNIRMDIKQKNNYTLILYDELGKPLYSKSYYLNEGTQYITLDLSNYPINVYFITLLQNTTIISTRRIIKQ